MGQEGVGLAKPQRTNLMTEKSETLPVMEGEAGLDTSTTARESDSAPVTYAYEPDTATSNACTNKGSNDSGGIGARRGPVGQEGLRGGRSGSAPCS